MWWLIFNAAALGVFLVLASRTWLEPELRGISGANGGAGVVWALTALPVLFGTFLLDLIWFASRQIRRSKADVGRAWRRDDLGFGGVV
jgi:hypothetical protein